MHTVIYLICLIFYKKIKPLDFQTGVNRHRTETLFSTLYGAAVFITLLLTDSKAVFFGFGRRNVEAIGVEETFSLVAGEAFYVSILLALLFHVTIRWGGLLFAGRTLPFVVLMFVPGLIVNTVVASFLIDLFG